MNEENEGLLVVEEEEGVAGINRDEARLNITWGGQNGDLPDPIPFDAPDTTIRELATEAVRTGGIQGIAADQAADFADFVVDRFTATAELGYNRVFVRPKTPFGC